ncbi:MAG: nuclear transport factor 2 family protein [Sedimentisphaerales bacterium]
MNKSMTISGTVVLITLILCTRSVALDPDELLAIHHEYVTAMNAHDLDKMMSYWADDGIYDLVSTPPPVPKSYVQSYFEYLFSTFLDFHETEGRTLATNNLVVGENETVRTDPTFGNKLVVSPHLSIYDFEGDKIKQVTTYKDNLSDMVQRGQMDLPEMPKLVPSVEVPDPEPTGLSPMEANTELIARWNSRDAAHVAKMDRADFHIYAGPLGTTLDRAAMMALNEMYFTAFPDVQIEVVRMVDLQDSWVLTELISKGTHKGDFMGVPASGYLTGLRVVWLTRYDADGLVTEQSFYYDNITLLNQMTAPPYLVDGIWITTIPTPMGNLNLTTTYVAQDTERTRYSGSLEEVNPMPLLV